MAEKAEITIKVVLLGDSGVGKTSLALRYVQDEFHHFSQPTIGASFLSKTVECEKRVHLKIWDTAGQERYQSLTPLYFRGAGAAIFVFDICRIHSFQTLQRAVEDRYNDDHNSENNLIRLICGNKCDLEDHRSVSQEDASQYADSIDAFYCETSARENAGVTQLFEELAKRAAAIYEGQAPMEDTLDLREGSRMRPSCCNSRAS